VEMMTREEARTVLAAYIAQASHLAYGGVVSDDVVAANNAIAAALQMPRTLENARQRLRLLTAACSLLDAEGAEGVLRTFTKPAGAEQKRLNELFAMLDHRFRNALLAILRRRASAKPEGEPEKAGKPSVAAPPKGTATWIEPHEGVFAYVPNPGMTLNEVAAYVTGNPEIPDALAKLNGLSRTAPIPAGLSVIIPPEFIEWNSKAFKEMPDDVRSRIASFQQARAEKGAFERFTKVRPGPGVGLAPLTTEAIEGAIKGAKALIGVAEYAISFVAGVVHGLLSSVWDAVAGIAKFLYDILKSIVTGELISDLRNLVDSLKNLSWDKIKDALGDWAAEWAEKLHSASPWTAGHAHGYLTGYVMGEVAMLLLSGGTLAELKGAVWATRLGQVLKESRALKTLETVVAQTAKAKRALGGEFEKAVDALRKSRFGNVVKAVEVTGAVVGWTAEKVIAALSLPADIARYVAEKMVDHVKELERFFPRIKELTDRAKRWLFSCKSPCPWEAGDLGTVLTGLSNAEIEELGEFGYLGPSAEHVRRRELSAAEMARYLERGGTITRISPVEINRATQALRTEAESIVGSGTDEYLTLLRRGRGTAQDMRFKDSIIPRIRKHMPADSVFGTRDSRDLRKALGLDDLPWDPGTGPDLLLVDATGRRVAPLDLTDRPSARHLAEKQAQADALAERLNPDPRNSRWTVEPARDFYHGGNISWAKTFEQIAQALLRYGFSP